jgi:hypothetical protein
VNETGPFNPHFVRDVGAAFLVAGGGLLWYARDVRARPAALAGAGFLALHALIHLWDGLAGRERPVHLVHDLPLLFGRCRARAVACMAAPRFQFYCERKRQC